MLLKEEAQKIISREFLMVHSNPKKSFWNSSVYGKEEKQQLIPSEKKRGDEHHSLRHRRDY